MSVTPAGFIPRTQTQILAEISESAKTQFGDEIDLSVTAPEGGFIQIMAIAVKAVEDRAEEIYNSVHLATALGLNLDRLAAFPNLKRQPPRFATVSVELTGAPASPFTAGLQVGTEQAVVFQVVAAGSLDGAGEAPAIVRAVVAGQTGNVIADAIGQIVTAEPGITGVTNPLKSDGGFPVETDFEFLARIRDTRAVSGTSIPALLAALNDNPDVIDASILENRTDEVDENGLPRKSFEPIITGGVPEEFGLIIFQHNTGGIETAGTNSVTVQDSRGEDRVVNYSVPVDLDIFVTVNLTVNSKWTPANESLVKRNVITLIGGTDLELAPPLVFSGELGAGDNVISHEVQSTFFGSSSEIFLSIRGIETAVILLSKTAGPTLTDTIVVLPRENSLTDTNKIIVNVA